MDIAREPAAEKRGGKAGRVLGIIDLHHAEP